MELAIHHWSDCAQNNEPALPKGECDCGGFMYPKELAEWLIDNCPRVGLADKAEDDDHVIKNDDWLKLILLASRENHR